MHHYAVVAMLFATPNIDQTSFEQPHVVIDEPEDTAPASWLENLIVFLVLLCDTLGPEYCQMPADPSADDVMLHIVNTYATYGVPQSLPSQEKSQGLEVVADMYDHINCAEEGTPSVIEAALDTLRSMYEDLGGDPADLE